MDETRRTASAGKIQYPARESAELDFSGFSNDSLASILEAGVRERHCLEARFRSLCNVMMQLGVASQASRASRNKENDSNYSRNQEKSSRAEKYQSLPGHDSGRNGALPASSTSPDIGDWPPSRTGTTKYVFPRHQTVQQSEERLADGLHEIEGRESCSATTASRNAGRLHEYLGRQRSDERLLRPLESDDYASGACAPDGKEKSARSTDTSTTTEGGRKFDTSRNLSGERGAQFSTNRIWINREGGRVQRQPIEDLPPTTTSQSSMRCFAENCKNSSIQASRGFWSHESADDDLEREKASRSRPSSITVVAKRAQDSEAPRGIEARSVVSDSDDEQGVMRRVGSTRRQRFDEPASKQRENTRFYTGDTKGETAAKPTRIDVSVSDVAVEKGRLHGLRPIVSVNVNVGNPKASPIGQGESSVRASSGWPRSKTSTSRVFGANVKWDGTVQGRDTSKNLGKGFDTQSRGYRCRPLDRENRRGAEHSFMGNRGRDNGVEEDGEAFCVKAPGRKDGVEKFDTVDHDCGNDRFTANGLGKDGEIEVEDSDLPYRREEDGDNTGFACDGRRAFKAFGEKQRNDEKWRQQGRDPWTMREPAAWKGATVSRTLRTFDSSDIQDACKGRPWSQSVQPYHGLYARSLRANGLEPEYFRLSRYSRHPCWGAVGVDNPISGKDLRHNAYKPQADRPALERHGGAEDALTAERGRAPTPGLPDKLEAGRVWNSFNRRAELLGTMPPTSLRTQAAWMAKSGDPQYRVVEGSKGLLHSFCSSHTPSSASIRAGRANLRSCSYAFGAGKQGRPPVSAAATPLMVATANAWNAPCDAGVELPCERVKATDIAKRVDLWGQRRRPYLSRDGVHDHSQRLVKWTKG